MSFVKPVKIINFILLATLSWGSSTQASDTSFRKNISTNTGDQNLNDMRSLQLEMMVTSSEKKALKQLNYLIKRYKGSAMEPGLWFRKAELYMRRSKTDRFFSVNRESSTLVRLLPKIAKSSNAKTNIKKAVQTYDYIQRKFPRYIQLDLVLFNNGFARQQLKQDKQAEKLYLKMLQDFPDSSLVPETYLALGEMYFEQNKFEKAANTYEKVKSYPRSRIYPYARYKLGWSYYNLGWNLKALKELEIVVELANSSDSQFHLKKEALGDMVLFYSDVLPSSQAVAYFRKHAGDKEAGVFLLGLGRLYQRHSKFKDLEVVLKGLISDLPMAAQVPLAYRDLVEASEAGRKRGKAVKHLQAMHEVCKPAGSWVVNNEAKYQANLLAYKQSPDKYYEPKKAECQLILDKLTSNLALKWDRMSKKNKTYPIFAASAEVAYKLYLERGQGKKKTNGLRYALSELLFRQKKFREASQQYFITAQNTKNKKILHDASYSAIFSLQKSVKDKWKKQEDENEYVKLSSFYLEKNPKGKYVESVEFKRAFIVYENGRYDEAAPYLKLLGTKYAHKTQGKKAQDLYLDILNIKKDFTGIKNYAASLLKLEKDPTRKKSLKGIYQQAYFSEVQTLEKSGQDLLAVDSYQKFAASNMSSDLADKAWWNSIQLLQRMEEVGRLADDSFKFYQLFPKSKLQLEALIISAKNYEISGQIEPALKVSKVLKEKDKKNYFKWLSIEAEYEYLSGNITKAEKLFTSLAKSKAIKDKNKYASKLLSIAIIGKSNEKIFKRRIIDIVNLNIFPVAATAMAQLAQIQYDSKDYSRSFKTASSVIANAKIADKGDLSHARYLQGKILAQEFYRQSLKSSNPERIALVLGIKTEKLDKAQRALQATIGYGDPEYGVLALEEMAELYGHYSRAVRSMKLPSSIPEKDAKAFYDEMAKLAMPMEEKEVETLQLALEQVHRLGVHNGVGERLAKKVKSLNMQPVRTGTYKIKITDVVLPSVSGVGS